MANSKHQCSDMVDKHDFYDLSMVRIQREKKTELLTSSSESEDGTKVIAPDGTENTSADSKTFNRRLLHSNIIMVNSQYSDIAGKDNFYDLSVVQDQRGRRLELLTSSSDSGNDSKTSDRT